MRTVSVYFRSLCACSLLLIEVSAAIAQQVPQLTDSSQVPPPLTFQQTPNLVVPTPDVCDTNPCIKAASSSSPLAPAASNSTSQNTGGAPESPTLSGTVSTAGNAATGYQALTPLSNAAANSLPKSNPLSVVNFPEIPAGVGYAADGAQVAIQCYQGFQSDGLGGCVRAGGKEALAAAAQTYGTEVGTCLAAETGPFAPAIGVGVGLCARAATEYVIDHPDVLQGMQHAFDCDPYGNCTDLSLQNTPDTTADGTSARQNMENSFDQTSDQNDAAAAQAAQQAADARANQFPQSDSGAMDILAALSAGLNGAATRH